VIFYKHYIGDYAMKTGSLSLIEHGAYLLMLQAYYGSEQPLRPGDELYRATHAHTDEEKAAVDRVAAKFWRVTPKGLVNGRAFKELKTAEKLAELARQNGAKGGRPRKPSGLLKDGPKETQRVISDNPAGFINDNPAGCSQKSESDVRKRRRKRRKPSV
jgi:uncharacterized protein YdaU (DUF1376 family)